MKKNGFKPAALNRWIDAKGAEAVPLYEGKMVQMYDHRAADVVVNAENLHRAAQPETISVVEKMSMNRYPKLQFFVLAAETTSNPYEWALGYKEISAPTNAINLFILEQLPVIAPARFDEALPAAFAQAMRAAKLMNGHHPQPTVADFVIPQVLALTNTAQDMAPFARDLGYVDAAGQVLPPFVWSDEERRTRLAALDALFFYLYGLSADDAAYILDTFPIVRDQDIKAFGSYRTQQDVLAHMKWLESRD